MYLIQFFKGGQALISSKHILYFSKSTLNKHLNKLTSDESLKKIIVTNNLPVQVFFKNRIIDWQF